MKRLIIVLVCIVLTACSSTQIVQQADTEATDDGQQDDTYTPTFDVGLKAEPGHGEAIISWGQTEETRLFWLMTDPAVLDSTVLTDIDMGQITMGDLVELLNAEGYQTEFGFIDDAAAVASASAKQAGDTEFVNTYIHTNLINGMLYCYRVGGTPIDCTIPMGEIPAPGVDGTAGLSEANFRFQWGDDIGAEKYQLTCRGVVPGGSFDDENILWEESYEVTKPTVGFAQQKLTGLSNCEDVACQLSMINKLDEALYAGEAMAAPDVVGVLDTTFGVEGLVERKDLMVGQFIDIVAVNDGIVVLDDQNNLMLKYSFEGVLQWEYDLTPALMAPQKLAVTDDGDPVVVGTHDQHLAVCKVLGDGLGLDSGFAPSGTTAGCHYSKGLDDRGYAITIDSDGRIVAAGADLNTSPSQLVVERLSAEGELDNSFASDGRYAWTDGTNNPRARDVIVVGTGEEQRIIVIGYLIHPMPPDEMITVSVNNTGTSETVVADGGLDGVTWGNAGVVIPDGTFLAVGESKDDALVTVSVYLWNFDNELNLSGSYSYTFLFSDYASDAILDCRDRMIVAGKSGFNGMLLRFDVNEVAFPLDFEFANSGRYTYSHYLTYYNSMLAVTTDERGAIYSAGNVMDGSNIYPAIWKIK